MQIVKMSVLRYNLLRGWPGSSVAVTWLGVGRL